MLSQVICCQDQSVVQSRIRTLVTLRYVLYVYEYSILRIVSNKIICLRPAERDAGQIRQENEFGSGRSPGPGRQEPVHSQRHLRQQRGPCVRTQWPWTACQDWGSGGVWSPGGPGPVWRGSLWPGRLPHGLCRPGRETGAGDRDHVCQQRQRQREAEEQPRQPGAGGRGGEHGQPGRGGEQEPDQEERASPHKLQDRWDTDQ